MTKLNWERPYVDADPLNSPAPKVDRFDSRDRPVLKARDPTTENERLLDQWREKAEKEAEALAGYQYAMVRLPPVGPMDTKAVKRLRERLPTEIRRCKQRHAYALKRLDDLVAKNDVTSD